MSNGVATVVLPLTARQANRMPAANTGGQPLLRGVQRSAALPMLPPKVTTPWACCSLPFGSCFVHSIDRQLQVINERRGPLLSVKLVAVGERGGQQNHCAPAKRRSGGTPPQNTATCLNLEIPTGKATPLPSPPPPPRPTLHARCWRVITIRGSQWPA